MIQPEMQARLQAVRSQYRASPWIRPHVDDSPLLRSWQRSRDAGLREADRVQFDLVPRSLLSELKDRHGVLAERARPELDRLASSLRGTGCAVLLYSAKGYIFDRRIHETDSPSPLICSTRVGINLSERCVGTTAPAIAVAEGEPYLVGRDAHYCVSVKPFFCVAAPIDSPQGVRQGALDITSYESVPGFDVLSLVIHSAAIIENSLFDERDDRLLVRFHVRPELVGTPLEAIVEVDERALVTGVNRAAALLLCRSREQLLGASVADLFDRRLTPTLARRGHALPKSISMQVVGGLEVHAQVTGAGLRSHASAPLFEAAPACAPTWITEPKRASAELKSMRDVEWATIESALAALDGNVAATARHLGISRNTIYRRRSERSRPRASRR